MFNLKNKKSRSIATQGLLIVFLSIAAIYLIDNVSKNLAKLGIASGFDFLLTRAGYDAYSPFLHFTSDSTHLMAYFVGLLNTIVVSLTGIILATLLGFMMGILRLSDNLLVNKTVYWIVEFTRNVPVLVWIVIWYFGVFLQLPSPRKSFEIVDIIFVSNRGLYVPKPEFLSGSLVIFGLFILGLVSYYIYRRQTKAKQYEQSGHQSSFWIGTALIIGLPCLGFLFVENAVNWSVPVLKGFNFRGGVALKPEFVALLMGLSLYTSASIAEIVRAGILAVPKGQIEASKSLNLTTWQTNKMIIIPQALRVIIPPLNSQFMNLTKNSSLAIAIGYVDVVATIGGITLNQTGQALECIAVVMATYLILCLLISIFMNFVNRQVQVVER